MLPMFFTIAKNAETSLKYLKEVAEISRKKKKHVR